MTVQITSEKLLKTAQLLLLVAIFGLLLWSQPWQSDTIKEQRTISVSGEATISAEPDEFVFYPYYEKTGTDRDALRDELVVEANQVVDELRQLGVEESDIKLDASSYDNWYWNEGEEGVLTVRLTVTTTDRDQAQAIQDYLLTTSAKGQLTPQAMFSEAKQKELDAQAVAEASEDARAKAEAQAKLFDAKLGDVITVNQQADSIFGFPELRATELSVSDESASSLPVLPGENDYRQTVNVVYELQ